MKIAIPMADGKLCMHFGHCETFALLDVDPEGKKITAKTNLDAPPHEPGLLPKWLAEKGVKCVIAGGMGQRAVALFQERGVTVITGAPADTPEKVVTDFLENRLSTGPNACDH
ncbi:MAG TPA: NifB/NifX family molybdenum-iron cluster-binding protein [Spirochaetota bacterium]|nr:NifB/NifX family molybdenum-iron cluster-binding protein [Spirochaetota bacterium]